METTENKLSIEKLENIVINHINKNNSNKCTVDFVYSPSEHQGMDLYVITHNPVHKNNFLFSKTWGVSEFDALQKCVDKLDKPDKPSENNYTVTWEKIGGTTQNSYFTGIDIEEVLKKFYFQKVKEEYIIFNIKLNPIS